MWIAKSLYRAIGEAYRSPSFVSDIPFSRPSYFPAPTFFVGRGTELAAIRRAVGRPPDTGAHLLLIEGGPGVGKTSLVRSFVKSLPEGSELRFAFAHCYGEVSSQSAYHPFLEILSQVSEHRDENSRWRRIWKFIAETAPDWLELIPAVGPALGAGMKSIHVASELIADAKARGSELERQFVTTVQKLAEARELPLLVIEDAHLIDVASCTLLNRLVGLSGPNVTIVLTYRPTDIGHGHPLRSLINTWLSRGQATRTSLTELGEEDVARYLVERFGSVLDAQLPRWLLQLCSGHPMFIAQYLNLLEDSGTIVELDDHRYAVRGGFVESRDGLQATGPLAALPIPGSIEALLEERVSRLLDEERELLQIGSIQGERFFSLVLAQLLKSREHDILARLRRVAERHRLIRTHQGSDWYKDRSEAYVFEHLLMQRTFYERLSPRERVLYHADIAKILEESFADRGRKNRQVTIEIAYHLAAGNQPVGAARHYYGAARSSFDDGAFAEVEALCEAAVAQLLKVEQRDDDTARLFAESVLLMLTSGSRRFDDYEANQRYLTLARTGAAAAKQIGANDVSARLTALAGSLLIPLGYTDEAIKALKTAVELAESSGDQLTRFFALTKLGENLAKSNLADSIEVRRQANEIYETSLAALAMPAVERLHGEQLIYLGLGYLDVGSLDRAQKYLESGAAKLRKSPESDYLIRAHAYLAQFFMSVGLWQEALDTLSEVRHETDPKASNAAWTGYSMGLLGKVFTETGRFDDAHRVLAQSLTLSEATNRVDLVTLVRIYAAELLMHPDNPNRDLPEASRVLARNLNDSRVAVLHRSEVLTLGALAELKLLQKDGEGALEHSDAAVRMLAGGAMPAVCTEEVYFRHYRLLSRFRPEGSEKYLADAHGSMMSKLDTICDPRIRQTFVERIPLNGAITAAYRSARSVSKTAV